MKTVKITMESEGRNYGRDIKLEDAVEDGNDRSMGTVTDPPPGIDREPYSGPPFSARKINAKNKKIQRRPGRIWQSPRISPPLVAK